MALVAATQEFPTNTAATCAALPNRALLGASLPLPACRRALLAVPSRLPFPCLLLSCCQVARLRPSIDLAAIVEKMEIIDAVDITLVRFLGSGG